MGVTERVLCVDLDISLQPGPGREDAAAVFCVWAVHLKTLAPLRPETASVMLTLGPHFSAYLLMSGCCSDSKTRLQLSWHLFTPRISTTTSAEENTDAVSVL